ncbi:MAG: VWA domain-containing protein [Planctomycetes bacterium]|nr:VWA domain-containing protein [Planctomycetota bacterium]
MSWLSFANPALGLCLLGVAIPIAIHLYHRREPRQIEFPTIRFLRRTVTEQSIFRRLRHIILLALRALFIALVAFAFLKPFISYSSLAANPKQGGTAAVLVLDGSMSMGYIRRGVTPFAKAKAEAIQLLDSLRPGDRANLILAAAAPVASYPRLAPNVHGLEEDLHRSTVTAARADIAAAFRMAAAQLARDDSPQKEVYVFSDFQRSNWSDVDLAWIEKDYRVYFVDVGIPDAANRAITSVAVRPNAPVAAEPMVVECQVANFTAERQDVPVRLRFDTGEEMERSVRVPPFSSAPVSFPCRMGGPGTYPGEVSIPEDGLAPDDRRFFVIAVQEKVRVLIVTDSDPKDRRSASYFLSRAMRPSRDGAGKLSVRTIRPDQLRRCTLKDYDVILLAETGAMGRDALARLLHTIREGGSVVFFLCDREAGENLAALDALGEGERVLPFTVGEQFDLSAQRNAFTYFREANFDSPLLQMFRNPEKGDLTSIKVYRFHQTIPVDDLSEVLLTYEDGTIAMARRNVGSGTLVLCNFSPALDASNLARNVNFVPLIHEMIRHLRPQQGTETGSLVGEPCRTSIPLPRGGATVTARGPASEELAVATDRMGDSVSVAIEGAAQPGVYRVLADGDVAAAVAVNVHPDESDLRPMDKQAIAKRSRSGDKHFVEAGTGERTLAGVRLGRPIWHYFLMVSLLVISMEQALTHRWRRT